jgi:hypothetical protein
MQCINDELGDFQLNRGCRAQLLSP